MNIRTRGVQAVCKIVESGGKARGLIYDLRGGTGDQEKGELDVQVIEDVSARYDDGEDEILPRTFLKIVLEKAFNEEDRREISL